MTHIKKPAESIADLDYSSLRKEYSMNEVFSKAIAMDDKTIKNMRWRFLPAVLILIFMFIVLFSSSEPLGLFPIFLVTLLFITFSFIYAYNKISLNAKAALRSADFSKVNNL